MSIEQRRIWVTLVCSTLALTACAARTSRTSSDHDHLSSQATGFVTDDAAGGASTELPVISASIPDGLTDVAPSDRRLGYLFPGRERPTLVVGLFTWPEMQAVPTISELVDGDPQRIRRPGVYAVPTAQLSSRWYVLKLESVPPEFSGPRIQRFTTSGGASVSTLFRVGSAPQLRGIRITEAKAGQVGVRLRFSEAVTLAAGSLGSVVTVTQNGVTASCQLGTTRASPQGLQVLDAGTGAGEEESEWNGTCQAFDLTTPLTFAVGGAFRSNVSGGAAASPVAVTYAPGLKRRCGTGCWEYDLFSEFGPR